MPRLHARARLFEIDPGKRVPMMDLDVTDFRDVVAERFGDKASTSVVLEDRLHLYIQQFYANNGGHVIGDDAWPLFQVPHPTALTPNPSTKTPKP